MRKFTRGMTSLTSGLLLNVACAFQLFAQSYLIGATVIDGVNASPAKISIAQIYNPPNSGVVFYLTSVEPSWNATDPRIAELNNKNGFDMGFNAAALGTLSRYMISTDAAITADSPIEIRGAQLASPYPFMRLTTEKWQPPQALYGIKKKFDNPLRIPPGSGFLVRPAQSFTWTIVDFEGYTVPVE